MYNNVGVVGMGIKLPILKQGDNLVEEVVRAVLDATAEFPNDSLSEPYFDLNNKDVLGITESIVARVYGQYVTVDEIADDIHRKCGNKEEARVLLMAPIYSRNRFSMILKGIARGTHKGHISILEPKFDEVGNPSGVNPFTGCDIDKYYREICEAEGCTYKSAESIERLSFPFDLIINCELNPKVEVSQSVNRCTLRDICNLLNPDFGLLGTNKASEEKLKLFPTRLLATTFCEAVKSRLMEETGKDIYVCVYGDGCFKDPVGGIWEKADPVTMPGYTNPEIFESTPNEIKIKAFADDKYDELQGEELTEAIKQEIREKKESLKGNMASQGTTPRLRRDLFASVMDLISGSGDRGTPVVLLQHLFDDYSTTD